MNQLSTQKEEFEFIPFTHITSEEMPQWIGDVYLDCFDRVDVYEEPSLIAEYVPTKFMVMDFAYMFFDEMCYHFAMNGYDEEVLSEIQYHIKEGRTEEEITDMWYETRDYNGGYGGPNAGSLEDIFMKDINLALNRHHMSYLVDDFDGNIYHAPERVVVKEWVNCPLVSVW